MKEQKLDETKENKEEDGEVKPNYYSNYIEYIHNPY